MKIPSQHPLQSPAWAEFRKRWGNTVVETKYGIITLHKIPFTNYKVGMFIKGPTPTSQMLGYLKSFARQHNLIFIKLEPNTLKNEKIEKLLKQNGCVKGKTFFTPTTFWIDLTKKEEDLLASFKPKTRYNIRLAQKKGVVVLEDNSPKAFDEYISLTRQTTKRQNFYAHNEKYHRLMWETLHPAGIAHLLVASYNSEILTTWILFSYKDFLYYPYGASSEKYKNVMPNNLMMWEAIKFGKKNELKTFDLWGRELGKGFTPFKEGFNPEVVEFVGTWDLVLNKPLYFLYRGLDFGRWFYLKGKSSIGLSKPKF